jgi:hypothetical protein
MRPINTVWETDWRSHRYIVEIEATQERIFAYRMSLRLGTTYLVYGPRGGGWYGISARRLRRKGERIARRLNRRLDRRDQRDLDLGML